MGGGYEKAAAVADKIAAVDPPEGYFTKAQLARKRKELSAAEHHLRSAVAAAPHEVGHMITLAKFLASQGRIGESDSVFQEAAKIAPDAPRVWFERADLWIKQKRNLNEAKSLLEKYLNAQVTVDDPPKQAATKLLKEAKGA